MLREALTRERLRSMDPDEAAAYFVARRGEGLTSQEEDLLAEWMAADEANPAALRRVERGWDWLEDGGDHEIIAAMRAHALSASPQQASWWPAAAIVAAVLIVGLLSLMLLKPFAVGPPPQEIGAPVEYASAEREVRQIRLPDGSLLALDAASKAVAQFGGTARAVTLKRGRAFFTVTPDHSRPFEVTAAGRRVVALGTRFEVDLAEGGLSVSLAEGWVSVAPVGASAAAVFLEPGQQFVERDGKAVIRPIAGGAEDAGSWTDGLLRFDDETLAAAAAQVNLYSHERLVVRDPAVAAMRISGEFRAGDAMRFARTVAELRPVRVIRRGGEIELVGRK